MQRAKRNAKKIAVTIVGGTVLIIGIITIPYPGPGWLTVFAGLAILATEFAWAQRLLDFARHKYDTWQDWLKKQSPAIRWLFIGLTAAVVIVTIWLFNGYGMLNDLLRLDQEWLRSPLI